MKMRIVIILISTALIVGVIYDLYFTPPLFGCRSMDRYGARLQKSAQRQKAISDAIESVLIPFPGSSYPLEYVCTEFIKNNF